MGLLENQRQERIDRIMETARRMIAERGYEGVNMRDLAAASRVSVPTLYNLCGDKAELLSRSMQGQFSTLLKTIDRETRTKGLDRVISIVTRCSSEMLRLSRYSRAVLDVFVNSGQMREVSEMIAGALARDIENALHEMKSSREIEAWVDPRILSEQVASHLIICALQWESGYLSDKALPASMLYGSCLMLRGVAAGPAAKVLEKRIRTVQADAYSEKPARRQPASRTS